MGSKLNPVLSTMIMLILCIMISYLYSSCLSKLEMLFVTCMNQSVKQYSEECYRQICSIIF